MANSRIARGHVVKAVPLRWRVAAGKIGESVGDWVAYSGVAGLCVAGAAWIFMARRRADERGILAR